MSNDLQIADVEAGRAVEGVYAVARKQRRHDKNGDAYLVIELTDTTGSIEGRVWKNVDWFDHNTHEGDRVRIVGRASRYRNNMQLDIRRLERVGAEDARVIGKSFIPHGKRDIEDLAGELDFLAGEITNPQLSALTAAIWQGPDREALLQSPATAHDHHAYVGGLSEHTLSVVTICLAAAERHSQIDRDLILCAALVHDIGRLRELALGDTLENDAHGVLVGHVLLGHEMLLAACTRAQLNVAQISWWAPLVHAISTHHGPLERCRTVEAITLASANQLDIRLAARER